MTHSLKRLLVAIVVAAIVVLPTSDAYARANTTASGAPGAGSAMVSVPATASTLRSTSTTAANKALPQVQSRCDTAVKNRVTELENLKGLVNASKYVKAEDKSGLLAEIASDESGLNALDSKIQADITTATAATDCKGVVTNYRVFVLEAPKVREVLAVDNIGSIDAKFQALSPVLAAELKAAQVKGTDVTAAETALTDLNNKAAAISKTDSGLAGPVLSLQPSGFPGTQTTIKSTRQSLGTMATEAKGARADIKTIATALGVSTPN